MKELRAFVIITIFSMSMIATGGLLIPYTYGITECDATITSEPEGAEVWIDGAFKGQTPYLHYVGNPFEADIRIEMEGFETWEEHIVVGRLEHKMVHAVLTPLQAGNGEPAAVTKTVTATVTTTSPTTITTTSTTTIAANTITSTTTTISTATMTTTSATTVTQFQPTTTISWSTISTTVTETEEVEVGSTSTVTYVAIGIAVIAVVVAIISIMKAQEESLK